MSGASQELADDARHLLRAATGNSSADERAIPFAAAGPQATAATLGTATDWHAVVATFRP
jgi:hypothetical protein